MAFVVEVIFVASAGWQQSAQAAARCKRGAVEARRRGNVHPAPRPQGLVRRGTRRSARRCAAAASLFRGRHYLGCSREVATPS